MAPLAHCVYGMWMTGWLSLTTGAENFGLRWGKNVNSAEEGLESYMSSTSGNPESPTGQKRRSLEDMAKKKKKRKKQNDENESGLKPLSLTDVTCPICLSLLMHPVTLPCGHELCRDPCYEQHVHKSSLQCPLCRMRISTWARKASQNGNLVNKTKWEQIKRNFPEHVERREKGLDDPDSPQKTTSPPIRLCKPGEIRKEFDDAIRRVYEEDERERHAEELQSQQLIQSLQKEEQEEEERRRQEMLLLSETDRRMALDLAKQWDSWSSPAVEAGRSASAPVSQETSSSVEDLQLPTTSHGTGARRGSNDSKDSISPELSHFRPIRREPKTFPVKIPEQPKVVKPRKCVRKSLAAAKSSKLNATAAAVADEREAPGSVEAAESAPGVVSKRGKRKIETTNTSVPSTSGTENDEVRPSCSYAQPVEAREVTRKLELEEADFLFAQKLQRQFQREYWISNQVDRRRGSIGEYQLRSKTRRDCSNTPQTPPPGQ